MWRDLVRATDLFSLKYIDHYGVRGIQEIGAALLLASWDGLVETYVSARCDFDESSEENEQESDDSHDDFERRMATSSLDEDTNVSADEHAIQLVAQYIER
jgi:hypothetical protein